MDGKIHPDEALKRLIKGNKRYIAARRIIGDISAEQRKRTLGGQNPYAVIIACSDSRVIPEAIFTAGIGELFVIRVAGNVMDKHQLGSVEYAVEHLGTRLVVVLGHDYCGAVDAALHHEASGHVKFITDEIKRAIGGERDDYRACCLNAKNSAKVIEESLSLPTDGEEEVRVVAAMVRLESGEVDFL